LTRFEAFQRRKAKYFLISLLQHNYAVHMPKGEIYQVVFIASTDDSKDLLDMRGLYDLGFGRDLKSEKEVLALGPLKAFKMTWEIYD
jgi:hypothetical protein